MRTVFLMMCCALLLPLASSTHAAAKQEPPTLDDVAAAWGVNADTAIDDERDENGWGKGSMVADDEPTALGASSGSSVAGGGYVHAKPAPKLPLKFDDTGRVVDPPMRRAASLQLDIFAAYAPDHGSIKAGVGMPLAWLSTERLRCSVLVGNEAIGAGVAYRVIPVIDGSIGAGYVYDTDRDKWTPIAYVSMFKW